MWNPAEDCARAARGGLIIDDQTVGYRVVYQGRSRRHSVTRISIPLVVKSYTRFGYGPGCSDERKGGRRTGKSFEVLELVTAEKKAERREGEVDVRFGG
jgi:hypothetical protein